MSLFHQIEIGTAPMYCAQKQRVLLFQATPTGIDILLGTPEQPDLLKNMKIHADIKKQLKETGIATVPMKEGRIIKSAVLDSYTGRFVISYESNNCMRVGIMNIHKCVFIDVTVPNPKFRAVAAGDGKIVVVCQDELFSYNIRTPTKCSRFEVVSYLHEISDCWHNAAFVDDTTLLLSQPATLSAVQGSVTGKSLPLSALKPTDGIVLRFENRRFRGLHVPSDILPTCTSESPAIAVQNNDITVIIPLETILEYFSDDWFPIFIEQNACLIRDAHDLSIADLDEASTHEEADLPSVSAFGHFKCSVVRVGWQTRTVVTKAIALDRGCVFVVYERQDPENKDVIHTEMIAVQRAVDKSRKADYMGHEIHTNGGMVDFAVVRDNIVYTRIKTSDGREWMDSYISHIASKSQQ